MMKTAFAFLYLILACLVTSTASAETVTANLLNRNQYDSGDLIWNQALGQIHPRNVIVGWDAGGGAQNTVFPVGDGHDGSFEISTYTRFDPLANSTDKIIRLSTERAFHFTKFDLESGWKIIPTGNKELIIYSLSTVVVNGEIHCHGGDGGSTSGASNEIPGAGGIGRCGGGNGGRGGFRYVGNAADAAGVAGSSPTPSLQGGQPGTVTASVTTGAGGGGGGAFTYDSMITSGINGNNSVGGAMGTNSLDHAFTEVAGSAGGGGGSGSNDAAGAGGGAGGGVVIIHAVSDVTIGPNGAIYARGGRGGNSASIGNAGGGGGSGGGGSIKIFSSGNFFLRAVAPCSIAVVCPIDAQKGTAGDGGGSAGDGGVGSFGRIWIAVGTYDPAPTSGYLPAEDIGFTVGDGRYEEAPKEVISKIFDSKSTLANYKLAGFSSSDDNQVTLKVAGSNDNFVADDSGWIDHLQISEINNKRYFRFLLEIDNNSATTPVVVNGVSVEYDRGVKNEFEFKQTGSGCGLVQGGGNHNGSGMMILMLVPLFMYLHLRRKTFRVSKSK